jgi:membrane-associated protease RseP (regulator of RpoE activity)
MSHRIASFSIALLLAAAGSLASAADTPQPPLPPAAAPTADQAATQQQLDEANERLDKAAQDVARLSAQLGGPIHNRMMQIRQMGPGRALLGVQVDPESKGGARVLEVSPGGAAAEAGINSGDLIVALDGKDLRSSERPARELVERMRELKPEQKVKVQVLRDGKTQTFEVTPRALPPMFTAGAMGMPPGMRGFPGPMGPGGRGPSMMHGRDGNVMFERGDFGGMELANLSPKLGGYFGAKAGVLVVRAGAGFGDKLQDGDVIVAIDGREPRSGAHATRILRSYQRGEQLSLKVLREKKSLTLDVALPPG